MHIKKIERKIYKNMSPWVLQYPRPRSFTFNFRILSVLGRHGIIEVYLLISGQIVIFHQPRFC